MIFSYPLKTCSTFVTVVMPFDIKPARTKQAPARKSVALTVSACNFVGPLINIFLSNICF